MATVYDRIQTMTKDELQKLIYYIYLWGHLNEQCNVDDEHLYGMLLDADAVYVDDIIKDFDNTHPIKVLVIPIEGGEPRYLDTKFLSDEDAYYHIKSLHRNLVTIDPTTYATSTIIFKFKPCDGGKLS